MYPIKISISNVYYTLLIFFSCNNYIYSQNYNEIYVKYIDTVDLRKHLRILASDSLEGRMTGSSGQQMAAAYIRNQFIQMNCEPVPEKDYYQKFDLISSKKSGTIQLERTSLTYPFDFGFHGLNSPLKETVPFAFVSLSDFTNPEKNYAGTNVMLQVKDYKYFIDSKLDEINCAGLLVILENYDKRYFTFYKGNDLSLIEPSPRLPMIFLNQSSLPKQLKKQLNPGTSFHFSFELNKNATLISTENVIAFVEGSDPILKNEIVVISAHYDHLGKVNGKIFNGADDNASGTSGLLEIAEAFQKAKNDGKQPKRSVLFIALTGEELGLLGSDYYVQHPFFPLNNTVTDLNIDMIGRPTKNTEKEKYAIYVIGADRLSMDLHNLNEAANSKYIQLDLDYKYNDENDPLRLYYRSDHYNFAKNNIPSIFYFGGMHSDYHKETDEIEGIDFMKLELVTKLIFHTAWSIADASHRPVLK